MYGPNAKSKAQQTMEDLHGDHEAYSDLTGFWHGLYWYGAGGGETPFNAYIADRAGALSGTTLELQVGFVHAIDDELSATIEGSREGEQVRFRKLYDPAPGVHSHPIFYAGQVDPAFLLIEGQWTFRALEGVGGFRLERIRASRRSAEIEERLVALVGDGAGKQR